MPADDHDNQPPPALVPRAVTWAAALHRRHARVLRRLLRRPLSAPPGAPAPSLRWAQFAARVLAKQAPPGRPAPSALGVPPAYAPLPALPVLWAWPGLGGPVRPGANGPTVATDELTTVAQRRAATARGLGEAVYRAAEEHQPEAPHRMPRAALAAPDGAGHLSRRPPPAPGRPRGARVQGPPAVVVGPQAQAATPGATRPPAVRRGDTASASPARPQAMTPVERAAARLGRSSPLVLDQPVIELLTRVFHLHVPGVKLYANEAADTLARTAGADALAYPDRIVFRGGALHQRSPAGLALLGHELTHVARMRAQAPGDRPPDPSERAAEEREALHTESALLRRLTVIESRDPDGGPRYAPISLPPPGPWRGAPPTVQGPGAPPADRPAQAPLSAPSSGGHSPRAAAQTRDLGPAPPPATAPALSAAELRALKEEIFRDLRARIRVEAERGA